MENVDYSRGAPPEYKCSGCGAHGVKLWRQYQTVASALQLKCADCAVQDQKQDDGRCVPRSADAIGDDGRWHGGITSGTDTIGWLGVRGGTRQGLRRSSRHSETRTTSSRRSLCSRLISGVISGSYLNSRLGLRIPRPASDAFS